MRIKQVTSTEVFIEYRAPVGPYVGRPRGGQYRATNGASGLIVKVETEDGLVGWGEGTGAFECDVTNLLKGDHAAEVQNIAAKLASAGMSFGPASGVEMALWDLVGKRAGLPICQLWGGVIREEVDFCACMGIKDSVESAETARLYIVEWGFRHIKTKAGDDLDQDVRIAQAIQKEIGNEAVLRPDANAGYTPQEVEVQMQRMKDIGVCYFEDPCDPSQYDCLVRVRKEIGMNVLINTGVVGPESIKDLLVAGVADYLMPDTPAAGGMQVVKQVAEAAAAWNVPCLMHCGHDFGLKTAAVAHIAACTANFSGLNDTCYHGLVDDILVEPLVFKGGCISVPMKPGLGVDVDEEKLEKYRQN